MPDVFMRPSPLRWIAAANGRRALAGEIVLRPATPGLSRGLGLLDRDVRMEPSATAESIA